MGFLFDHEVSCVSVANDEGLFPVHRIYCVGKNYAEHTREMGGDPAKDTPCFFSKPPDSVVPDSTVIPFPGSTENLHYEVELVVAIGKEAQNISPEDALDVVYGYAVGIDLTRRDLQNEAKAAGRPWEIAKGFDFSAPISAIHQVSEIGHPKSASIKLSVNGELRQDGNIDDMVWNVAEIISELSKYFKLQAGDLIFTGTPSGVGKLSEGDKIEARIEGIDKLSVSLSN